MLKIPADLILHKGGVFVSWSTNQGVHGQGKSQGKNIFSRSGNCQGILKFVREFWNLRKSQGKVREFEIFSL